jgi:glycosyltransferase involved in cell wall biosynthesis
MVNRKKQRQQKQSHNKLPFVSVCTPTFNRRPFIPYAIKHFMNQDYPRDRMEWIIIDDGTDPIEDLVSNVEGVKYFKYSTKMSLGKKRNLMHEKSKGSIIVYMDDDDYYPNNRVSHAVETLTNNKKALCAGSSAILVWFRHNQKMYQFGPYNDNHATAGTFAFKRELLKQTSYDDDAAIAEEKKFLKNYTIPFVQLDPLKTILVFSHDHNTFDKRELLEKANPTFIKDSNIKVSDIIKDKDIHEFYTEKVNTLLADYDCGLPKNKPDVIKQTQEIRERREKMAKEANKNSKETITITDSDGNSKTITTRDLVNITKELQNKLKQLNELCQKMQVQIIEKDKIIRSFKDQLDKSKETNKQEEQLETIELTL